MISGKLELVPCKVKVDTLVIATVSNWGAYAVAAYIQKMTGVRVLPKFSELKEYLARIVDMGSVDGVTKEHTLSWPGSPLTWRGRSWADEKSLRRIEVFLYFSQATTESMVLPIPSVSTAGIELFLQILRHLRESGKGPAAYEEMCAHLPLWYFS